jgi:hypothetical protein
LKYAGITAAVVGASAIGFDFVLRQHPSSTNQMTSSSSSSVTPYGGLRLYFPDVPDKSTSIADVVYIHVLDKNSNVIGTISADVLGKDNRPNLKIPDDASFLEAKMGSLPLQNAGFKEITSDRLRMDTYLSGSVVDSLEIHPRNQIHYVRLRPNEDSDADGIPDKNDLNPRIPEPKPIKCNYHITVGYLHGFLGYNPRDDWDNYSYHSLLGKYRAYDPQVADWQIKWCLENGIDTFAVFFQQFSSEPFEQTLNLEDGFLRAKYIDMIKFYANYDSYVQYSGASFQDSIKYASATINYLCENYFDHPSYLRIGGRPILSVFNSYDYVTKFGIESFDRIIKLIRETSESNGYELYLMGDVINSWHKYADHFAKTYDAMTGYVIADAGSSWTTDKNGYPVCVAPYDLMPQGYGYECAYWYRLAKNNSKGFIPPVITGYSNLTFYEKRIDSWLVDRTYPNVASFDKMLMAVTPYVDPELRRLFVPFNEYPENAVLEPTEEYGFSFLNSLRNRFCQEPSDGWPPNLIPTPSGIVEH